MPVTARSAPIPTRDSIQGSMSKSQDQEECHPHSLITYKDLLMPWRDSPARDIPAELKEKLEEIYQTDARIKSDTEATKKRINSEFDEAYRNRPKVRHHWNLLSRAKLYLYLRRIERRRDKHQDRNARDADNRSRRLEERCKKICSKHELG
ncbi:hypothetical protein EJ05DRAFT_476167 [Pseudovirgaria hyperparasitica]|uniref:Uncharacterized protein n=1 Tax=Pseudovirgaria hyperparasitica TaxID=470096 RepID=A0A6A6W9T7_9PEZI|nr:uncharacterized protein EJ05DRAFT_476167 [Pseudovirgaria hyperparasitica]KAF2757861.1 hypothetical protein EJ05DRAFT_476167 [Pseudovirgaria hyperparasitica]